MQRSLWIVMLPNNEWTCQYTILGRNKLDLLYLCRGGIGITENVYVHYCVWRDTINKWRSIKVSIANLERILIFVLIMTICYKEIWNCKRCSHLQSTPIAPNVSIFLIFSYQEIIFALMNFNLRLYYMSNILVKICKHI